MATKVGATKGSGKSRRRWNGKRWVSAPVSTSRTPAARTTARTRQQNRRSSSSSSSKTIPASKRPKDMRRGVTYGDAGRPYAGPGGNPNGSGQGQAQQAPPAPKLPPRRSSGSSSRSSSSTSSAKPTPTKSSKPKYSTPSKTKGPLKNGSSYSSKGKSRSWLKDNYKPGKGPARRSTAGNAKNKPKQSSRMATALKNLKVRKYGKK